jgi:hypothetical protein
VSVVRARPHHLVTYGQAADQIGADLTAASAELSDALDALRASFGWQEHLPGVPPLELDVEESALTIRTIGSWTATFGNELAALDGRDARVRGVVAVDTAALDERGREVLQLTSTPPELGDHRFVIVDGHAHHRGSDAAELAELVVVDGVLTLRVSRSSGGDLVPFAEHPIPAHVTSLTLRTGDGNDLVSLPPGVADRFEIVVDLGHGHNQLGYLNPDASIVSVSGGRGVRVFAGTGDDTVFGTAGDDRVYLAGGSNTVHAGAGADVIVSAGEGANRLHGGDGDDRLSTGTGDDFLDGGRGADVLATVAGRNVLSAGRGRGSRLLGGRGDDTFVEGRGRAHTVGGGGDDLVHRAGPTAPGAPATTSTATPGGGSLTVVRVEVRGEPGSRALQLDRPDGISDAEWDAWVATVDADLELLRHLPSGNEGLMRLDVEVGKGGLPWAREPLVTLQPTVHLEDGRPAPFDAAGAMSRGYDHNVSSALSNPLEVRYDHAPRIEHDRHGGVAAPGAVVLYHELAHVHDYHHGRGSGDPYDEVVVDAAGDEVAREQVTTQREINAVGYDQDGDGRVDDHETIGGHPAVLTESRVRQELGLGLRPGYLHHEGAPPGARFVWETDP